MTRVDSLSRIMATANDHYRNGRYKESLAGYSEALALNPVFVDALGQRANSLRELSRFAEAEHGFRTLLELEPEHVKALRSLGRLLRMLGRAEEAIEWFEKALELAPSAEVHWDLAFTLLLLGRYRDAWPHYEYRRSAFKLSEPSLPSSPWRGESLRGKSLLILDEQGIGDSLQFMRFVPEIARRWHCQLGYAAKPVLLPLLQQLLPNVAVAYGSFPRTDYHVRLLSLPARLAIPDPDRLPAALPAPELEPERMAFWRVRLKPDPGRLTVAICWFGNPEFPGNAHRSPGLAVLAPVLKQSGCQFISVQIGEMRHALARVREAESVIDAGALIEARGSQLLDSLSVLSLCDFVVSPCTSVAHMAGLLDRPLAILLSARADWRWGLKSDTTPWYPSARLLRQASPGDWSAVTHKLQSLLSEKSGTVR